MSVLIGQALLGRYRVEAFLGRGGMSEVYKVWDSQRSVHLAMKMLREDLAEDKVFLRRFQREAQTLARLQHPNIVRFYGLEQDGPLAFMLMDYVEGTTLRREILEAKGPLPFERVLEILRPVCAALHYAHTQGMVHCDVKPGNIMIDRNRSVMLTDFGIARMTDAATATMVGLGTPAYMAPELVSGHDPTPQTDIYALGVVLYEMLTGGERPFTGERATVTGSTSEKVRWEQMNLPAPSPRVHNQQIPAGMELVILKCLAKVPDDRYGTVFGALEAVEGILQTGERAAIQAPEEEIPPAARSPEEASPVAAPQAAEGAFRRAGWRGGPQLWVLAGAFVVVLALVVVGRLDLPSGPEAPVNSSVGPEPGVASESTTQSGTAAAETAGAYGRLTDTPAPTAGPTVAPPAGRPVITEGELSAVTALMRLEGPPGVVTSLDWSPDSTQLVSGSSDNSVTVWEVETGEYLWAVAAHISDVSDVAWSPTGTLIASLGNEGTTRFWNAESGEAEEVFRPYVDYAGYRGLTWSPDGSGIAAGQTAIRVDEQPEVSTTDVIFGNMGPVTSVDWSPDGSTLAVARIHWDPYQLSWYDCYDPRWGRVVQCQDRSGQGEIQLYEVNSRQPGQTFESLYPVSAREYTDYDELVTVAWSPEGDRIAFLGPWGALYVWETSTWELVFHEEPAVEAQRGPSSLDWSPDGQLVVLTINGGPAEIRRLESEASSFHLGAGSGVTQVAWSPNGAWIAVGLADGAIEIWGPPGTLSGAQATEPHDPDP